MGQPPRNTIIFAVVYFELLKWCHGSPTEQDPPVGVGIRLVNGPTESKGRLEVYFNETWGTVCDRPQVFDIEDAIVVCRMLNFETSYPQVLRNASYGRGKGPIWLCGPQCEGTERTITECLDFQVDNHTWYDHRGRSQGNKDGCHHGLDVGIDCVSAEGSGYTTTEIHVSQPQVKPARFHNTSRTSTSISFSWHQPFVGREEVKGYTLTCIGGHGNIGKESVLNIPNLTNISATLTNLQPSTQYTCTVEGFYLNTESGVESDTILVWTAPKLHLPNIDPSHGQLVGPTTDTTVTLKLPNLKFAADAMRLIVVEKSPKMNVSLSAESFQNLHSFHRASEFGLRYYAAAQLNKSWFGKSFVVGDGHMYGDYENVPLRSGHVYEIWLDVWQTIDGVTDEEFVIILQSVRAHSEIEQEESGPNLMFVLISVAIATFFLITTVAIVAIWYFRVRKRGKWSRARSARKSATETSLHEIPMTSIRALDPESEPLYQEVTHFWEFPWYHLRLLEKLGQGSFGEVWKGEIVKNEQRLIVAVKTMKQNTSSGSDSGSLRRELTVLASVGLHPNVIGLIGACVRSDTTYVALELAPYGDLRTFLRRRTSPEDPGYLNMNTKSSLSKKQLVQFALDIANGMTYLSSKKIIHRDLAARNILVGHEYVAKIADFGLSKNEEIYVKVSETGVPLRWIAPECWFENTYTTMSDVWSYGIVLWEIMSNGCTPYPNFRINTLRDKLEMGYRMPKPASCDNEIYQLMLWCWQDCPMKRPAFFELSEALEKLILDDKMYVNTLFRRGRKVDRETYLIEHPQEEI